MRDARRPQALKRDFSELLKSYRERLGDLTWTEISHETGISRRSLSRWAAGETLPKWDDLQQLVWLAERRGHYHHLFEYTEERHVRHYSLEVEDKKGVLAHVAVRIAEHDGNIRTVDTETFHDGRRAKLDLSVEFQSFPSEVLQELIALPEVSCAREMDDGGALIEELQKRPGQG